jgi:hypothetical protein
MAVREPNAFEFFEVAATEQSATAFAQAHGLLLSGQAAAQVQLQQSQPQQCLLGTVNCASIVAVAKRFRADPGKHTTKAFFVAPDVVSLERLRTAWYNAKLVEQHK